MGFFCEGFFATWLNVVTVAFAVFTFKFYFSIAPIEVSLTVGGILLLGLAFFLFKFLKNKPKGFTSELISKNDQVSSIIEKASILQNFGSEPTILNQGEFSSGGKFGGGGAHEDF